MHRLNRNVLFFRLEYGYSTGYPGFGGQPAAQGSTPYVNYPQWNAQPNYNNTSSTPYSQPPPSGPPQGKSSLLIVYYICIESHREFHAFRIPIV